MPHEFSFIGIYLSPLLVNFAFGVILSFATALFLNYTRLSRFFIYPPIVFISLVILYTCFLSTYVLPA